MTGRNPVSGTTETAPLAAAYVRLSEAESLRRAGRLERAQSICEALVEEQPDYVGALQTLGAVHLERSNYREAFRCFAETAMLCPKDAVNFDNLAKACLGLGAHEMAARYLGEARSLRPGDRELLWSLANLHREQRDYESAADVFRNILAQIPDSAEAAHGLGDCLVQSGHADGARDALTKAHRLQPASVAILYSLSQLPPDGSSFDLTAALARVRRQKGQSEEDFAALSTLTRVAALDRRGDHTGAWANLLKASRIAAPKHAEAFGKHRPFMAAALSAARNFAPQNFGTGAAAGPLTLFILGPSRSGKTTLERLVASIAGVRRGHESRLVERATKRTSQLAGLLTIQNPADLPPALDDRLRDAFTEEVLALAGGARIVTDTYPAMIPYVGRVAATLPSVRFVFVGRDPYDAALRILMRQYRAGNHYAYDIATIFDYLNWYRAMAQVWREKLPGISLDLAYEDMVSEPALALAKVARLCGAEMPTELPAGPGDDRGCADPYRAMMDKARTG